MLYYNSAQDWLYTLFSSVSLILLVYILFQPLKFFYFFSTLCFDEFHLKQANIKRTFCNIEPFNKRWKTIYLVVIITLSNKMTVFLKLKGGHRNLKVGLVQGGHRNFIKVIFLSCIWFATTSKKF